MTDADKKGKITQINTEVQKSILCKTANRRIFQRELGEHGSFGWLGTHVRHHGLTNSALLQELINHRYWEGCSLNLSV